MKKKKLLIMAGIVAIGLLAVALVWYFIWGKNKISGSQETVVKIEASAGQDIVFAKLTSVKGNEITYTVAEKAGESSQGEMTSMPEGFEGGEMPAMPEGFEGGEMPDMPNSNGFTAMPYVSGNGAMPEAPQMPGGFAGGDISGGDKVIGGGRGGQRAEKGGGAQNGQRPEGGRGGNRGEKQGQSAYAFSYDGIGYQLTEESRTELIPVGTDVITKLGTVTTFSRLAAGDNVVLVMEQEGDEQVIVAVYIIG